MATVTELRAVAKARGVKGYSKMKKAELERAVGRANVPVDAAVEGIRANVQKLKSMHALTAEHVTRIVAVKKAIEDLERHIDKLEGPGVLDGGGRTPVAKHYLKSKHAGMKQRDGMNVDKKSPAALARRIAEKQLQAKIRRETIVPEQRFEQRLDRRTRAAIVTMQEKDKIARAKIARGERDFVQRYGWDPRRAKNGDPIEQVKLDRKIREKHAGAEKRKMAAVEKRIMDQMLRGK